VQKRTIIRVPEQKHLSALELIQTVNRFALFIIKNI
jgi:hypothetical protein